MLRSFILGTFAMVFLGPVAEAQTCGSYTYTLTNGQTADAAQVMGNFNSILNCANNNLAPLANPHFTGAVGIGTNAPSGSLSVQGSITQLAAGNNLFTTDANLIFGDWYSGRPSDNTWQQLYWNHSGPYFAFTASVSAPSFIQPSDERLKTDVHTISNALGLISRLRGVQFRWRRPEDRQLANNLTLPEGQTQLGFIAQEVAAVVPEAVVAPKAGSKELYGLKEANLIPILVEAVKEQQAQLDALRARLAAPNSGK